MHETRISVITKQPGEPFRHVNISPSIESMQKYVGGYFAVCRYATDAAVICNEEGKLRGMEPKCELFGYDFVGPIIIAGIDWRRAQFGDLSETAVKSVLRLNKKEESNG